MRPLVLASGSPRRCDLLRGAGVAFEAIPPDISEERRPGEAPVDFALRLAREKALAVAEKMGAAPARWVLGADTIVVLEGNVLGKPESRAHAVELLSRLVGRRHTVVTAVALVASDELAPRTLHVASEVDMRRADLEEIRDYVATGEPLDKAGAYAAQGEGRRFVASITGSDTNVIGLPIDETLDLLRGTGLAPGGTSA